MNTQLLFRFSARFFLTLTLLVLTAFAAFAQTGLAGLARLARFPEGRSIRRDAALLAVRAQRERVREVESIPLNLTHSAAADQRFFGKQDKVAGRTISDYAGDYLHYLFSQSHQPAAVNFAETEGRGVEYQHGPVWFLSLAGQRETRTVMAPRNTPLFVSLGWGWYWLNEDEPDAVLPIIQSEIEGIYDYFYDFQVSLDFEVAPASVVIPTQSPVTYWPLLAEDAEVFGYESCARVFSRAGMAGNFALLKPLAPGTHTLKLQFRDREDNYYLREFTIKVE